jgi:hypothetical protein
MSWECPKRKKKGGGGYAQISKAQRRNVEVEETKDGKSFMMRKVLLKVEKEGKDLVHRNNLFRNA